MLCQWMGRRQGDSPTSHWISYFCCIFIFNCNDALEAELHAIMQRTALVLQHSNLPDIVQSDSSEALSSLTGDGLVRSAYGHLVAEIKELMKACELFPRNYLGIKIKLPTVWQIIVV